MNPEEAEKLKGIKCDLCGTTAGLFNCLPNTWRCPACIWNEREALLGALKQLKDAVYATISGEYTEQDRVLDEACDEARKEIEKAEGS